MTQFLVTEDQIVPAPNEVARKDWIQGRDVALSDDQIWSVPLPRVEFRFTDAGGLEELPGGPPRETNRKFGARFWDLQGKLPEYIDRTDGQPPGQPGGFILVEYYRLIYFVAADLLARNYDLSAEEIRGLLTIIPGDESNARMWRTLNEIAMGQGSKADGGG